MGVLAIENMPTAAADCDSQVTIPEERAIDHFSRRHALWRLGKDCRLATDDFHCFSCQSFVSSFLSQTHVSPRQQAQEEQNSAQDSP
jgi:hypothetical protein